MIHQHMPLAALGVFAALCAVVVWAFLCYQLSLVFRGTTTNETFKWDDLAYDIKHGEVRIPNELFELNQRTGAGNGAKRRKGKSQQQSIVLTSVSQINNMYHRGAWNNLKDILFPTKI